MFGGWDTPVCFNDMFMLDLGKHYMDYSFQHLLFDFTLVSHCVMNLSLCIDANSSPFRDNSPFFKIGHLWDLHKSNEKVFLWDGRGVS